MNKEGLSRREFLAVSGAVVVLGGLSEVVEAGPSAKSYSEFAREESFELAALINENDFWSFDEEYRDDEIMDATKYVLIVMSFDSSQDSTLSSPGRYSVICYSECPEEIVEIIDKVKEIWGEDILEVGV